MSDRRIKEAQGKVYVIKVVVDEDDDPMEIPVTQYTTFSQVVDMILKENKHMLDIPHWAIVFAFKSSVRIRSMYQPLPSAKVLSVIANEEQSFPGEIVLLMTSFISASSIFARPEWSKQVPRALTRIQKDLVHEQNMACSAK